MKSNWKEATNINKIIAVISILMSIALVVLAMLQLFNVWEQAINVFMPLVGVVNLCEAYLNWKQNKAHAIFSIGIAAFIFICSLIILVIG